MPGASVTSAERAARLVKFLSGTALWHFSMVGCCQRSALLGSTVRIEVAAATKRHLRKTTLLARRVRRGRASRVSLISIMNYQLRHILGAQDI